MSPPPPARLVFAGARVRPDALPPEGRALTLTPSAAEREALAGLLGISAVEALDIDCEARPFNGGVRVTGRISAEVVQFSVLTLAPLRQTLSEPVDRVFLPGSEKAHAAAADAETFVDLDGEDLPDHFEGHEADLSDLCVEILALAIDPYPREPLLSLGDLTPMSGDEAASPFAALAALKPKRP